MMLNLSAKEICALEHALESSLTATRDYGKRPYHSDRHRMAFQAILDKLAKLQGASNA